MALTGKAATGFTKGAGMANELELWIDAGEATPEEVAELLAALDELYRAHGGSGFVFSADGDTAVAVPAEAI